MHSGQDLAAVYHEKEEKHSGWQHVVDGAIGFTAGTMGATASVYTGQPLDTVKVKMQAFPDIYRSSVRCFLDTYRKDGVRRGLYAGTTPSLAANISENAVLFASLEFCKKGVASLLGAQSGDQLNPLQNACAGSLAAVFSTFALCPTELVKCRLQAAREMAAQQGTEAFKHTGPWQMCGRILKSEGVLGFFKGFWPTFMREVPGYFFFFGGYETCRHALTPPGQCKDDIGALRIVLSGGVGGVSLWLAIFPADVIKSRVQIQGRGGMLQTGLHVLRNEGVSALYSGLGPTVVRSFFATGALFWAYESTKRFLRQFND